MAFTIIKPKAALAIQAASAINPYSPVKLVGTNNLLVIPAATNSDEVFGFSGAGTHGASGINSIDACPVYEPGNVAKAVCAASVGVGADLAIASTNGALGPIVRNAGSAVWTVGKSLTPAAPGERLSVFIKPRLLGGLS